MKVGVHVSVRCVFARRVGQNVTGYVWILRTIRRIVERVGRHVKWVHLVKRGVVAVWLGRSIVRECA